MILKQVHDTNMRAKGEPERVFTVSLTKPSVCNSWAYLLQCNTEPVYSSLSNQKKDFEVHFMFLKLDVNLALSQELVNPVNCSEYSSFLVLFYSI